MLNIVTITEEQLKTIYAALKKDFGITVIVEIYSSEDNLRKLELYAINKTNGSKTVFMKIYNGHYYEETKLPAATNVNFTNIATETYDQFLSSIDSFLDGQENKNTISEKYRMMMLIEDEDDDNVVVKTYTH